MPARQPRSEPLEVVVLGEHERLRLLEPAEQVVDQRPLRSAPRRGPAGSRLVVAVASSGRPSSSARAARPCCAARPAAGSSTPWSRRPYGQAGHDPVRIAGVVPPQAPADLDDGGPGGCGSSSSCPERILGPVAALAPLRDLRREVVEELRADGALGAADPQVLRDLREVALVVRASGICQRSTQRRAMSWREPRMESARPGPSTGVKLPVRHLEPQRLPRGVPLVVNSGL